MRYSLPFLEYGGVYANIEVADDLEHSIPHGLLFSRCMKLGLHVQPVPHEFSM
jgi:hypothetical protein